MKKKRFRIGYVLAIIIPIIIAGAGLYVFSEYLYGVENYSPKVKVEEYYDLVKSGEYEKAFDLVGIKTDSFNKTEEYVKYFDGLYEKIDNISYSERKLQRTEEDVFIDAYINKKLPQKFKLTKTGEKISYNFDKWNISLIQEFPKMSITVYCPEGVNISINNTLIDNSFCTDKDKYIIDKYKNVKDDNKNVELLTYQIDNLLPVATIDAKTISGEECEIILLEENDDKKTYLIKRNIPKDELQEMKDLAETITKKYSEYVANDIKFPAFAPYVYTESKLYDDLKEFYNAWFTPHQSYGFEDVNFFDMEVYDDTHYTLGVEFTYYVYKWDKRFDYQVSYHAYLLKVEDSWLLAELSIE